MRHHIVQLPSDPRPLVRYGRARPERLRNRPVRSAPSACSRFRRRATPATHGAVTRTSSNAKSARSSPQSTIHTVETPNQDAKPATAATPGCVRASGERRDHPHQDLGDRPHGFRLVKAPREQREQQHCGRSEPGQRSPPHQRHRRKASNSRCHPPPTEGRSLHGDGHPENTRDGDVGTARQSESGHLRQCTRVQAWRHRPVRMRTAVLRDELATTRRLTFSTGSRR